MSNENYLITIKNTDKYTIFKDLDGDCLCIQCKACGMVSYNSNDVNYKYCGNCKQFHRFRKTKKQIIDEIVIVLKNNRKGLHKIDFIANEINSCPKTVKKYLDEALNIINKKGKENE